MNFAGKVVLLIDDDPASAAAVEKILTGMGMVIYRAGSPQEGLAKLPEVSPHLIITEWSFGPQSRGEPLPWIAEEKGFSGSAILVLCSAENVEKIRQSMTHIAMSFLVKPVEAPALLQKLRGIFLKAKECSYEFSPGSFPVVQAEAKATIIGGDVGGFSIESTMQLTPDSEVRLLTSLLACEEFPVPPIFKVSPSVSQISERRSYVHRLHATGFSEAQSLRMEEVIRRWHSK